MIVEDGELDQVAYLEREVLIDLEEAARLVGLRLVDLAS